MPSAKPKRVYHRLIVEADPKTAIWLVDDSWHFVQKEISRLDTSVLPGRYFIELDKPGMNGVAYPIELLSDLRFTQKELEAGPSCPRQAPKFDDE